MDVSIIVPVHNELEYTKKCIESIKKNSENINYEIIIIDNGSRDETGDFIKGIGCRYIYNNENIGVAKAWNQGIKNSKGDFVCIINNDIIVCKDWLLNFLKFYKAKENIGILSPATREGQLNYNFEKYSEDFIKKMKNIKKKGFCGWCMFIKKDRLGKIGLFSEEYETGIGEDTDFYLRLKFAGFESFITGAVFIHHFGSITLNKIKQNAGDKFEKDNIKRLNAKWNIKEENYLIRKTKNFVKFLKNLYLKIFYGHTLLEK